MLANIILKRLFNIRLLKKEKTHTNLLKEIRFSFQTVPAEKIQDNVKIHANSKRSFSVCDSIGVQNQRAITNAY